MRILIGAVLLAAGWPLAAQTSAATTPVAAAAQGSVPMPAYDVVSIKPHKEGDGGSGFRGAPDLYRATNTKLAWLIMAAYGLQIEEQVTGLPGWAETAHYDVEAKVDADGVAALKARRDYPENRERRSNDQTRMLQAVLAERFGLMVHRTAREMPVFTLVVAKGGPKLKTMDPSEAAAAPVKGVAGPGSMTMMFEKGGISIKAHGYRMAGLAAQFQGETHRIVEDRTGLEGVYDFTLLYRPEFMQDENEDGVPSLFTALQEQLGLKLEPSRASVATIVVDRVRPPSEN